MGPASGAASTSCTFAPLEGALASSPISSAANLPWRDRSSTLRQTSSAGRQRHSPQPATPCRRKPASIRTQHSQAGLTRIGSRQFTKRYLKKPTVHANLAEILLQVSATRAAALDLINTVRGASIMAVGLISSSTTLWDASLLANQSTGAGLSSSPDSAVPPPPPPGDGLVGAIMQALQSTGVGSTTGSDSSTATTSSA